MGPVYSPAVTMSHLSQRLSRGNSAGILPSELGHAFPSRITLGNALALTGIQNRLAAELLTVCLRTGNAGIPFANRAVTLPLQRSASVATSRAGHRLRRSG